jgi:hypothetical protein
MVAYASIRRGFEATLLGSVPISLPPSKSPLTRLQPNFRHRTFDDVLLNPSTTRAGKRPQILARRVAGLNRRQLHWRATSRALWTLVLCIEHAPILRLASASQSLWRTLTSALAVVRQAMRSF